MPVASTFTDPGQARFQDVNNDGKADLLFQTLTNEFLYYKSTGNGFAAPVMAMNHPGEFTAGTATFADTNGDRHLDLIFQDAGNDFWVSINGLDWIAN